MSQRLEAFTLFSSSKGNSALFRYGQECVLIDAGVSARALNASLQALGTSLYEIRAIFVTHEHSDHIKGLETISKAFSIPIYAPYLCCRAIRAKCPSAAGLLCSLDGPIELGPFLMQPFPTPHDAEDSVCYRVEAGTAAVGYATDIGHLTAEIGRCILGCDAVVLESNHDIDMLKNGAYPLPLKKRILGAYGHLSNRSCAAALPRLVESGVAVIPKSSRKERMAENFEVFDFVLDAEDLDAIRALDQGESLFFSHYDPEFVESMADFGHRVL